MILDDIPCVPAPGFPVASVDEALHLSFIAAGRWLKIVKAEGGTPIGFGCRVEGPHGPVPCGSVKTMQGGPECDCGCSAFEDYCQSYLDWYDAKHPRPADPKRLPVPVVGVNRALPESYA